MITPSWFSGLWRSFLYSSSVYSCYLFLVSSVSVRSMLFLSFIMPIVAWNVPLVSLIFLKRSLVFPILLFSSTSFHWSLRKAFLSLLAFLELYIQMDVSFLFSLLLASLLFSAVWKAFCVSFPWRWSCITASWSLPLVQYTLELNFKWRKIFNFYLYSSMPTTAGSIIKSKMLFKIVSCNNS